MMEWKDPKKDGHPKQDTCCLIIPQGKSCTEKALFDALTETYKLDNISSDYAMLPIVIEYYMEIPALPPWIPPK